MSPAQRHRARFLAEAAARSAAPVPIADARAAAGASAYELQRARMGVDLRRLHEIQSVEKKIELKRDLLPGYDDWVAGVLAANTGAHDEVLVQVMIWRFDIGAWADAFQLAEHVLEHDMPMPDRFKSTVATFIVDSVADAAAKARGVGESFPMDVLTEADLLVEGKDMPDQAQAKLHKEIGLRIVEQAEATEPGADGPAGARKSGLERGLERLRKAFGLNSAVGVKAAMDRVDRELKKLTPPEA